MDKSLFSAMKIVALMLAADGRYDADEQKWFLRLIGAYALTAEQREQLRDALDGNGNVEDIHGQILRQRDRERLIEWARLAMLADGLVHPSERKLFDRIKELNERPALKPEFSNLDYANEILDEDREIQLWKELAEMGRFFSQRVNPYFGIWPSVSAGLASGNRYIIWAFAGFFFLIALIRIGILIFQ